jgi:hypothetical protein
MEVRECRGPGWIGALGEYGNSSATPRLSTWKVGPWPVTGIQLLLCIRARAGAKQLSKNADFVYSREHEKPVITLE